MILICCRLAWKHVSAQPLLYIFLLPLISQKLTTQRNLLNKIRVLNSITSLYLQEGNIERLITNNNVNS